MTSLSRQFWGLRRLFSTWGDRFSRMSFTWKLLAYNSCFIPRNDTKILWSKSLSINRGTNSGKMLNLINLFGSWKVLTLLKINLSYLEIFYKTIYHGYWKCKVWYIFAFYLIFFTSRGGYLLNTALNMFLVSDFPWQV